MSMCWVLEIDEMNGLICVEMDRIWNIIVCIGHWR